MEEEDTFAIERTRRDMRFTGPQISGLAVHAAAVAMVAGPANELSRLSRPFLLE